MKTISLSNAKKLRNIAQKKGIELPYYNGKEFCEFYYLYVTEEKTVNYNIDYFKKNKRILVSSDLLRTPEVTTPKDFIIPAYTIKELLEWLPAEIIETGNQKLTLVKDRQDLYIATYQNKEEVSFLEVADTPEDALCLLALSLLESSLIK